MKQLSLPMDKEGVRATLVVGLVASIIALGPYVPKETPSISLVFGVLLTYWFMYGVFTAYGVSETENVKLSHTLRWLGDLSFHFGAIVVIVFMSILMIGKWLGLFIILEWNYLLVWCFVICAYLTPTRPIEKVRNWKKSLDSLKSNWKSILLKAFLFFFMTSPLLVLQFYPVIFGK